MKKLIFTLLSCLVSITLMAEAPIQQKVATEQHTINDINKSYSISLIDENAANLILKGIEHYENFYWNRFWAGMAIALGVSLVGCTVFAAIH